MRYLYIGLILSIFCFSPFSTKAQFVSATLGLNGLTCSLCSYGVQNELEQLDFVEHITLDLNTNIAEISFLKGKAVNIGKLVDAVYKAGFSVGFTKAVYLADSIVVSDHSIITLEGDRYEFIKPSQTLLKGPVTLSFIDKKFVQKKTYNFWKPFIKKSTASFSVYHVTL